MDLGSNPWTKWIPKSVWWWTVSKASWTGPKPHLGRCNSVNSADSQVLCWVCLLALFTCMYVVCASMSAQWFMKTNLNSSQGRTRSLLDCETANSAMPTCSSAEKCKHGFCKSLQTHNPNHNMVITLQLFWIKWARSHQHRSLKHRKQSCIAYDIF